jgi:hypothetical protein
MWINCYRPLSYAAPFGGYKKSGIGRENGLEAISGPGQSRRRTGPGRVGIHQVGLGDSLVKSKGPVSIAVDASGIKVHDGGDWIRCVWKVRKGYLKMECTSLWT